MKVDFPQAQKNMYYLIVVLIFCGTSVPTFLVGKLTEAGWTDAQSWSMAAVVAGVIVLVSVGMMWRATKGHNPINDQALAENFPSALYAIQSACSICLIPFITKLAISHDKRNVYVACMAERELR